MDIRPRQCEHVFVSDPASFLHADLDAFFASVEQRDNPSLRGRPVIVGGGVVLAASYEAKAFGVRTAMSGSAARRACPFAVVVPPRMSAYSAASKQVFEIFHQTSPLVEGISIDEAFIDVTGLRRACGSPMAIAEVLRQRVWAEVGLRITVGIAGTKFLAKVASAVAKPDGLLLVEAGHELEFLHPLPIERLWGVGRVTADKLHNCGIYNVGQIAELDAPSLTALLGPASGHHLYALARGRDPRPVVVGRRRRSIGAQRALGRPRRDPAELDTVLIELVDRVSRRMRDAGRRGGTVVLRLRFEDFTRATRSLTLAAPTDSTPALVKAGRTLLTTAMPMIGSRGLTMLGISVGHFHAGAEQLELPFDAACDIDRAPALDAAMDKVRERFGGTALTRAVLMGRNAGMTVPLLPD